MKSYKTPKQLVISLILILFPLIGFATSYTYTWTGMGGNSFWYTNGNWTSSNGGTTYPGASGSNDIVIFDNTSSADCSMNFGSSSLISITITNAYTGTITQASGKNISFSGDGTFSGGTFLGSTGSNLAFAGNLTLNGTNFTSSNNLTVGKSFDWSTSLGSFNHNNGLVIMSGTTTMSIKGTPNFNNLTITALLAGTTTCTLNNSFTVFGDFTLSCNIRNLTVATLAGVVASVNGNLSLLGTTGSVIINTGTILVNGNVDVSSAGTGTTGGGTGIIKFNGVNQTLTGSSAFQRGTLPDITIANTGNLTLVNNITTTGNWSITSGTIVPGFSKVYFYPSSAITISSGVNWTLYDAVLLGNVNGTITFTGTGPTVNDLLIIGNSNGTNNATTVIINSTPISTNALQTTGSNNSYIKILSGIIDITGIYAAATPFSLNIANTSANNAYAVTDVLGTIRFVGSTYQVITRTGAASSGTYPTGVLPNIEVNSTGTLDLGVSTTATVGNWLYTKGTVNPNISMIYFYGFFNGTQTVTSSSASGSMNFYNVNINGGGTIALGSDIFLLAGLSGAGSGTYLEPTASNYGITIQGDWTLGGDRYNPNNRSATVTFSGSTTQNITKYVGSIAGGPLIDLYPFYHLVINKTSNNVNLNSTVTVSGTLTLTKGNIISTSANILQLTYGSATVGLGSTAGFVDGPVRWDVNSAGVVTLNCPIGSGTDWSPLSLSTNMINGSQSYYTVQMMKSSAITSFPGYSLSSPIKKISAVRYWSLSQTNTNSDHVNSITAYFNTNDQVTDVPHLSLARATTAAGPWVDLGIASRSSAGGPLFTGSITTSQITKISQSPTTDIFTFDDDGTNINPLPITVSSFIGAFNDTHTAVDLAWVTESEEEGTYFTLERADKSLSFESLTTIKPAYGDGRNGKEEYTYIDTHPLSGLSYYRLKETGKDGIVSYHGIVNVNSTIEKPIGIYPNPGNGNSFSLVLPNYLLQQEHISLTIRNQVGEIILTESIELDGKKNDLDFTLKTSLPAGMYYVNIAAGAQSYPLKYFVKE